MSKKFRVSVVDRQFFVGASMESGILRQKLPDAQEFALSAEWVEPQQEGHRRSKPVFVGIISFAKSCEFCYQPWRKLVPGEVSFSESPESGVAGRII
jgi:hypothetical protein